MVFSSVVFLLVFLPVTFCVNLLMKKNLSNCFLLLASLFFYAWGEPLFVFVMIAVILINWFCGMRIGRTDGAGKKGWMLCAVILDLALLGCFKYLSFLVSSLNQLAGRDILPVPQIALPIGISFFTFQAISYVVDVYRGKAESSRKLISVALYISFFPQLIAGPIVKYQDISHQIENRQITADGVSEGFRRFIFGLSKKVLIANVLGACSSRVLSYSVSSLDFRAAWVGALAYAFQIYYDFSGYSDMAIGLGKMFGFTFLENFRYPYLSASVGEFWRRWHISLGSWFREYVYIPLGGNRKGTVRTCLHLAIVFLLTGLWHGANVTFILWGAYHGFFAVIERLGFGKRLQKFRPVCVIGCFLIVTIGWVLFSSPDTAYAVRYLGRMLLPWRYAGSLIPFRYYLSNKTIAAFIFGVLGAGLMQSLPEKLQKKWKNSVPEALFCVLVLILSIAAIAGDTYNPFIYFQF
ncbi:MAG: MBOAT family protein [Clostridia bacterium]|nr:MBOAT family protein [Clostridia bacterium]